MHSTNYFVRYQMESLEPVGIADLRAGMILYKSREDTAQLNERYQPGGRYYTGDMLDYYHVGVVESVYPLVIVHCTKSGNVDGITRDYKLGNWSHAGRLKNVVYDETEETDSAESCEAVVTAPGGKTVNLRSRPGMNGLLYARVPIGARVTVHETAKNDEGERWSKVSVNGLSGYMKTDFLSRSGTDTEKTVTLRLSVRAAAELCRALAEVSQG